MAMRYIKSDWYSGKSACRHTGLPGSSPIFYSGFKVAFPDPVYPAFAQM